MRKKAPMQHFAHRDAGNTFISFELMSGKPKLTAYYTADLPKMLLKSVVFDDFQDWTSHYDYQ